MVDPRTGSWTVSNLSSWNSKSIYFLKSLSMRGVPRLQHLNWPRTFKADLWSPWALLSGDMGVSASTQVLSNNWYFKSPLRCYNTPTFPNRTNSLRTWWCCPDDLLLLTASVRTRLTPFPCHNRRPLHPPSSYFSLSIATCVSWITLLHVYCSPSKLCFGFIQVHVFLTTSWWNIWFKV